MRFAIASQHTTYFVTSNQTVRFFDFSIAEHDHLHSCSKSPSLQLSSCVRSVGGRRVVTWDAFESRNEDPNDNATCGILFVQEISESYTKAGAFAFVVCVRGRGLLCSTTRSSNQSSRSSSSQARSPSATSPNSRRQNKATLGGGSMSIHSQQRNSMALETRFPFCSCF
jgi:hypothetical protein